MKKIRLDVLLVDRKMVESRSLAQRLVMAGQVRVDGQVVLKPSAQVAPDAVLSVEQGARFVSRGGEKLESALQAFGLIDLNGKVCVDVGASTGGFTDCLLQHSALKVYAVDVGYGELHWKLRNDPRVVVMERTNARNIAGFPEAIQLVTVDASFISLRILLPVIQRWMTQGEVVVLIKPQFEAGKKDAARGEGVIRDPTLHRQILEDVLGFAQSIGFGVVDIIRSPLLGPKGNKEFLAWLVYPGEMGGDLVELVDKAILEDHLTE
jgi:23S rRNA (cytidine1920-2'-O)/16S rRNA (cytidine1409-2'-O)-methyltransferase